MAALAGSLTGSVVPSNLVAGNSARLGAALRTQVAAGGRLASTAIGMLGSALFGIERPGAQSATVMQRLGGVLSSTVQAGARLAANGIAALASSLPGVVTSGTQVAMMAGQLAPVLLKVGTAAAALGGSLIVIVPLAIALAAALGALLAAFVLLVGSLTIALAAFVALAGGIALVAAGAAMLVADMFRLAGAEKDVLNTRTALNEAYASGDSERIEAAERAHAEAMNRLAAATAEAKSKGDEYYAALQTLITAVDNFKSAAETAFTPVAAKMAEIGAATLDVATNAMPQLGAAATASAQAMVDGYNSAYDSSTQLQTSLDAIPPILESGTTAATNFGSAFNSFMEVALPYALQFMEKVEEISAALASWADSEEGRAQIQAFLDAAVPVAEAFWDALVKVGGQLLEFAQNHGPAAVAAIEAMAAAVSFLISVLETALSIAESLVAAISAGTSGPIGAGGSVPAGLATGGDVTGPAMATGGDIAAMADGGDIGGAHFVSGPKRMDVNGQDVLYGEALSGSNREYAFPMDGGYRFITEEPGFDAQSFALWADLGNRKGFFGEEGGQPMGAQNPVGASSSSSPSMAPATRAAPSLSPNLMLSSRTSSTTGTDNGRLEQRLEKLEASLVGALQDVKQSTDRVAPGVGQAMNQQLAFGKHTGTAVHMGLSRDAQVKAHEGTF